MSNVPEHYKDTYTHHMNKGKRVLAIACKAITPISTGDYTRDVESNLSFIGFMVFDCALKPDSKSVINELIAANYKLVMITGDRYSIATHSLTHSLTYSLTHLLSQSQHGSRSR